MNRASDLSRFQLRSFFLAITVLAICFAYIRAQHARAYREWRVETDLIVRLKEEYNCKVTTKDKGTAWVRWPSWLTDHEADIFLRATSVAVDNGSPNPLPEIFGELKNFKHLEEVNVTLVLNNYSTQHFEETIASVEQQGKDALPDVAILIFAIDP